MKQITHIIQDCSHCDLINFDGTRHFCTHPKMKRTAVIPLTKDSIHPDCPLPDHLPDATKKVEQKQCPDCGGTMILTDQYGWFCIDIECRIKNKALKPITDAQFAAELTKRWPEYHEFEKLYTKWHIQAIRDGLTTWVGFVDTIKSELLKPRK